MTKPPAIFQPKPGTGAERASQFRSHYPQFLYRSYIPDRLADSLRVTFHFQIEPDIEFAPQTIFPCVDWARVDSLPPGMLENLLLHLGLIETLSYWKATCSPEIRIEAGPLDSEQIGWFLDLLRHGMGEFFYVNQIDWRAPEFVRIVASEEEKQILRSAQDDSVRIRAATARERWLPPSAPPADVRPCALTTVRRGPPFARGSEGDGRDLVLTSGGKDSVVTLELLRGALSATGRAFDCLLLNPAEAAIAVARQALLSQGVGGQAGCAQPIILRRTIDPRLLELNAAGYLNGHTPFSALLAVLGVTAAALYGHNRVIVSNERSAEEADIGYLGEPINHQYSKTLRFETSFREYSRKYLAPPLACHPERSEGSAFPETPQADNEAIEYFSLLRPLYELQIARLFAQYPEYFPLFRSCNRGMKTNTWCGRCSKCLFVYTSLYPFLEREQILAIFGTDLFAGEGAAETLCALLGLDAHKPFECVGTREETLVAIYLCVEKMKQQGIPLSPALREIEEMILSSRRDLPELARSVLTAWTDHHHLPPDLGKAIQKKIIRR